MSTTPPLPRYAFIRVPINGVLTTLRVRVDGTLFGMPPSSDIRQCTDENTGKTYIVMQKDISYED